MKSAITTHVLDTAQGKPAAGIPVTLENLDGAQWRPMGAGITDDDGRISDLLPAGQPLPAGSYRISFHVEEYLSNQPGFYSIIPIVFRTMAPADHYHVPLLLSPFGYTTYRGS